MTNLVAFMAQHPGLAADAVFIAGVFFAAFGVVHDVLDRRR